MATRAAKDSEIESELGLSDEDIETTRHVLAIRQEAAKNLLLEARYSGRLSADGVSRLRCHLSSCAIAIKSLKQKELQRRHLDKIEDFICQQKMNKTFATHYLSRVKHAVKSTSTVRSELKGLRGAISKMETVGGPSMADIYDAGVNLQDEFGLVYNDEDVVNMHDTQVQSVDRVHDGDVLSNMFSNGLDQDLMEIAKNILSNGGAVAPWHHTAIKHPQAPINHSGDVDEGNSGDVNVVGQESKQESVEEEKNSPLTEHMSVETLPSPPDEDIVE